MINLNTSSDLNLLHFVENDAQLLTEVLTEYSLELLFKSDVAWFESVQHQVTITYLVFAVLAKNLKLAERVIKHSMPRQDIQTCPQVIHRR